MGAGSMETIFRRSRLGRLRFLKKMTCVKLLLCIKRTLAGRA
jgi:hypothetical protein